MERWRLRRSRVLGSLLCALGAELGLVGATLGFVSVARAGGRSIAGAPQLVYGQLEAGGGTPDEFWRIATYGGDQLTLRIDWGVDTLGMIEIYPPSVDDYTLTEAKPVGFWQNDGNEGGGKRQYVFTIPFTGNGTLAICERNGGSCDENPSSSFDQSLSDPFSFTVTDAHATGLSVSAPRLARRRSTVTVTGHVQSPAGVPQGSCLFPHDRVVPLTSQGVCAGRVRLGGGHRQSVRVEFVGDDGWQSASARRTIRLLR